MNVESASWKIIWCSVRNALIFPNIKVITTSRNKIVENATVGLSIDGDKKDSVITTVQSMKDKKF